MRAVVARTLEARAKLPKSKQGGTAVGLRMARAIVRGDVLGPARARRAARFLSRNRRWAGRPLEAKSGQAWGLWGGSPAVGELRELGVLY